MRSLFWLVLSGIVWLGVVQAAGYFDLPPQIVSLARSGYIGTFSIFMLLELRRETGSNGATRPKALYLYLAPLMSLIVLGFYSPDLTLTPRLLTIIAAFYACQFMIVYGRAAIGQIRSPAWDVLPPFVLLAVALGTLPLIAAGIATLVFLLWLFTRPVACEAGSDEIDAIVIQLPSICIAPVVLIALRDVFDAGQVLNRAHVESFGLVVNGAGAAIWMAIVMRASQWMRPLAVILWGLSLVMAGVLAFVGEGIVASALAICVAEGFRGSNWLGMTFLLSRLGRWPGFALNLIGTALPLAGLWIGMNFVPKSVLMLVYAAFLAPVPFLAWRAMGKGGQPRDGEKVAAS